MGFKKNKYDSTDAVVLLRYALTILLVILLPITLFLTAYSWYGSLAVRATGNPDIANSLLFLKNSLVFGTIATMSCLPYFALFFLIKFALHNSAYRWKKYILIAAILAGTIVFLLFEILSIFFMDYYYSWELSLVLIFWPLIFVIIAVLLLVDYFTFYNEQKDLSLSKKRHNEQEKEINFKDQTEVF